MQRLPKRTSWLLALPAASGLPRNRPEGALQVVLAVGRWTWFERGGVFGDPLDRWLSFETTQEACELRADFGVDLDVAARDGLAGTLEWVQLEDRAEDGVRRHFDRTFDEAAHRGRVAEAALEGAQQIFFPDGASRLRRCPRGERGPGRFIAELFVEALREQVIASRHEEVAGSEIGHRRDVRDVLRCRDERSHLVFPAGEYTVTAWLPIKSSATPTLSRNSAILFWKPLNNPELDPTRSSSGARK